MANRFSIEAVFKAIDKVTAPVSRMQNRVGKFTRKMSRGFHTLNRSVGKFAKDIKRAGIVAVAAVGSIGFALKDVIMIGAEFGRAIGSAAAKFPDKIKRGTKEFKALKDAAREVGATTEFTAIQAAEGLGFLAKAGFDAKFSMNVLKDIVDFATASELELAEASDIASDALGAFGLDSDDPKKKLEGMRRVMDVMSLTANSANTSVAELFETVKKGGPVAIQAGSNIETYSAMMAVLASNSVKSSEAGTAAKNITLALAGVGNKAAKTFKKLGISLKDDVTGNLRDQLDVLDDLRVKLKTMGTGDKIGIISAIFGKIPLASASILLSDAGKKVREFRTENEKALGTSKRVAKFIRDDLKGSIDSFSSAIQDVKIQISEMNEGPLKEAIDRMTNWIRLNGHLIAQPIGEFLLFIITNLDTIVVWIKRIGIGLGVFFAFVAVLKTLVLVLTAVNLVMALNPIGLIVIGVAAAIAAFTALVVWIDDVAAGFDKLPGFIQAILGPIGLLIKAIKFMKDNIGVVADMAGAVGSFIGLGDDEDETRQRGVTAGKSGVVSPHERVARNIEEQRTTSTAEVKLTAGEGTKAELTSGKFGNGLSLQQSGAF